MIAVRTKDPMRMDGGRRIARFDTAASVVRRIDSTSMAMRTVAARV
jgi:hypothetical protein